ncbi:MAG: PHP domain-containing protein, partial [candidate division WOR-3 bacterium]
LHIHTTYSDGLLTPEEVVKKAKELNLSAIAIADHDAVGGIEPAKKAGEVLGIEVVPCVELSCLFDNIDIHILAYFIDYHNSELLSFLEKVQKQRLERAKKIIGKLSNQGIKIEMERVLAVAAGGSVGRPHIAQILVEDGYVRDLNEAFMKFIGYHCPAYVPKMEIGLREGIALIKRYQGVPILAHPGTYPGEKILPEAIKSGIMGIEVWHPEHNLIKIQSLLMIAKEEDLLVTGGSDCHGGRKGEILIGKVRIPDSYLQKLKKVRFDF